MREERTEAALASETRAYGYEKGAGRTMGAAVMTPEVAQEQESTLEMEEEAIGDIGVLDSSEVNELVDLMESDTALDDILYRSDEDEDSEDVRALNANPKRIVRKVKRLVSTSMRANIDRYTEEETRPLRKWLLSACRSCGTMIRFRSDEPQPPTCGKPQCIERFEERSKAGMLNKAL
ncbi:hypothetical protein ACFL6S_30935 [Candidatus Poribacteria bacterium]